MADIGSGGGETQAPSSFDYVLAALGWRYNVIAMLGAAGAAVATGSELPLLLAAGAELMYVSIVPQSRRFQRLVRAWHYARDRRQREKKLSVLFHELPDSMRKRYAAVSKICTSIRGNYRRLSSTSQLFTQQMEERLTGLLHAYLRLLHAAFQHREHLRLTDPEVIRKEADQIERALPGEAPRVQEINRKRIEILRKRLDKYEKIQENCQVIDAQCAAIEDVLDLVRDQSVTLRDPQQLSHQLDNLVKEVEQTEQTVREVEAIFDLATTDITLSPMASDASSSTVETRTRVRT